MGFLNFTAVTALPFDADGLMENSYVAAQVSKNVGSVWTFTLHLSSVINEV